MPDDSPVTVDVNDETGMIMVDSDGEVELTPEEARELAADLEDAADEAEENGGGGADDD